MDGSPNGRVKCTLANWTGVAYQIPRADLERCKGRDDLSQSGVYFLFGVSDQTDENTVYIGQAGIRKNGEGILNRLQEHKKDADKDYWTEAVVFTTSNNSFGPTEISYLENQFCSMAAAAQRYKVKNGNDPSPGNITEEKKSEMEEFIEYAVIIMGVFGHKVFEPLGPTVAQSLLLDEASCKPALLFFATGPDADGRAELTGDGIFVLAGSKIREETVPSFPESARRMRELNKNSIDENGILLEDILFKSPSGAAAFVLGRPANGNIEWKTEDGRIISEF